MKLTEKQVQSRVILITGSEDVLQREALGEIFRIAGIQADDFDLETFAGDESMPMAWVAAAGTAPFLADRRMVVVRHLLRCDTDHLKSVNFADLPGSSLLVLVADEVGGSEDRLRKAGTQRQTWEKAVAKAGGVVVTCEMSSTALRGELKNKATEAGKSMSDKAIEVLVEMTGSRYSRSRLRRYPCRAAAQFPVARAPRDTVPQSLSDA